MKLFTSLGIWGVVAGAASIYLVATIPERSGTFSCRAGEIIQERAGLIVCVPSGIPTPTPARCTDGYEVKRDTAGYEQCVPVNHPVVRIYGDSTTGPVVDGSDPILVQRDGVGTDVFTVADRGTILRQQVPGSWRKAPTPKPVKFPSDLKPPYMIENGAANPILTFTDENRAIVTIKDGDMPKGPCDLGDLARAVRKHLDLEHPEPPTSGTYILSGTGSVFMWKPPTCEPNAICAVVGGCPETPERRRARAACELRLADEAEAAEKARSEAEKLRADALGNLRLKLAACEVAK